MSNNFIEDNAFSDKCIYSKCLSEEIIKSGIFGETYNYKDLSGSDLDKDNNIDGLLNDTPVQMHMQRFENVKGPIENYCAYVKFSRNKTRAKTEFTKIKANKKQCKPYPKYIIWAIIDPDDNICHKIQIQDVDQILKNLKQNKKKYKQENNNKITINFYHNSKYYKTYRNPSDGTVPLYLISDKPIYENYYDYRDLLFESDSD